MARILNIEQTRVPRVGAGRGRRFWIPAILGLLLAWPAFEIGLWTVAAWRELMGQDSTTSTPLLDFLKDQALELWSGTRVSLDRLFVDPAWHPVIVTVSSLFLAIVGGTLLLRSRVRH